MATFQFDEDGIRQLEEELTRKFKDAVERGEVRTVGGPPAVRASAAVVEELRAIGAEADEDAIRGAFERAGER